MSQPALKARSSNSARVEAIPQGWRLSVEAGDAGNYRLAQLDNYAGLPRRSFPHDPPLKIDLDARCSHAQMPGTWGFGLWNDPFGFSLGFGGTAGRLPALPNALWFFFASPENHLSLNDQPGHGATAAAFSSPRIPAPLFALATPLLPFLLLSSSARMLRRAASKIIRHDVATLDLDPTSWHHFTLSWQSNGVQLSVDDQQVLTTPLAPRPPLGLVLWVDNQYAAWHPDGRLAYGTLPNPQECRVEIKNFHIQAHA
jgi:hypothetical protein